MIASLAVSALLMAGCECEKSCHKGSKLEGKAKVGKEEATKIALAKAPGGTVKESELENEKGKLIWSFDISMTGTKDITEVNVDANSGEVVAVEHENVKSDESKEKKHKKHSKEKDDDEKDEKK